MFEKLKPEHVEIGTESYPYICDMKVLEQIQEKYGDLTEFEDKVLGLIPFFDSHGERNRKKDKHTIPDVERVCGAMAMMIAEGAEIEGAEIELPTADDLKRQNFIKPIALANLVYAEFVKNF